MIQLGVVPIVLSGDWQDARAFSRENLSASGGNGELIGRANSFNEQAVKRHNLGETGQRSRMRLQQ